IEEIARLKQNEERLEKPKADLAKANGNKEAAAPRLLLTSEQKFTATYLVAPEANNFVPQGSAAIWMEVGTGLKLETKTTAPRIVQQVGGKVEPGPISAKFTSPVLDEAEKTPPAVPTVEQTAITLRGVYRGQRLSLVTPVDLFPLADNIRTELPQPRF